MLDRRHFLYGIAGLAGALTFESKMWAQLEAPRPPLPEASLFSRNQDRYWRELRKQFIIPEDMVYLNNGSLGSCPLPVMDEVFKGYRETEKMVAEDPEDYPMFGYGPWNDFRDPVAKFLGVNRDELALTRNATEGCSAMAFGFDLKPGDEVIITDQEHPAGKEPWKMRAKRQGIVVKEFQLPKPPKNSAEILNIINDTITPRTRIIAISHISYQTGLVLPVKEISSLARSKGIISCIDGAQVCGMMPLDLHDLGCDAYCGSPHKWLMAPKGSGFLYVRDEIIDRMWSNVTQGGWDDPKIRAEKFQHFGTTNVPALWGLREAINFANQIGLDRIHNRTRELADYALDGFLKRGVESWTSPDKSLRCGIISVNVPPIQRMDLENWLWKKHRIRIRGGEPSRLRISTGYYVQKENIDRFFEKFDEYRKTMA